MKLIYSISRVFLAWTFLNFLAHSATPSSPHYANYVNYEQQSVGAIPKKGGGGLTSASEAESSGDSTSAMLNEAADAVAKYFAKLTQGINKGKCLQIV